MIYKAGVYPRYFSSIIENVEILWTLYCIILFPSSLSSMSGVCCQCQNIFIDGKCWSWSPGSRHVLRYCPDGPHKARKAQINLEIVCNLYLKVTPASYHRHSLIRREICSLLRAPSVEMQWSSLNSSKMSINGKLSEDLNFLHSIVKFIYKSISIS